MKRSNLVYCVAHCKNKTCGIAKQFIPVRGDYGTADFSDRCDKYIKAEK